MFWLIIVYITIVVLINLGSCIVQAEMLRSRNTMLANMGKRTDRKWKHLSWLMHRKSNNKPYDGFIRNIY